jgi:Zn-dependent protease
VGGTADQIVVWPLGGLAHVNVSHEPQNELVTALAGPLVNLAVCVLISPLLVVAGGDLVQLVNPFVPPAAVGAFTWQDGLRWLFWMNWLLVLVNLLPAFPLDGGRVLRALLWAKFGYRSSVVLVSRVAKFTAIGLCLLAWVVHEPYPFATLPLALFGIFLFFSAKQEADRLHEQDPEEALFGYDFSQGYTSLEKTLAPPRKRGPGPLKKWLDSRRAARLARQQQVEADEERRVDEVLARLHERGQSGLSDDDRALLERVSARYRNRMRG